MPSTALGSRGASWKRLRTSTPSSSAVCSWTVRSRQLWISFAFSKTPMVMLVLPASSASSTHTSRQDNFVRPVVLAHHQESGFVESRRRAVQDRIALQHDNPLSAGVTGAAREQVENGCRAAL